MNIVAELRRRFAPALASLGGETAEWLEMIRPSQDPRFGDYQANFAMPLAKRLGQSPREVAQRVLDQTALDDLCLPPEIAGPGFINLRLRDDWLAARLCEAERDLERRGVAPVERPRTYVIDYSSPNVAKPMHVGHIRSTVIGDALYRTLKFVGHCVTSVNHVGDWGTQFGMIIYGWKHFRRPHEPAGLVAELSRLYRLVNQLCDDFDSREAIPRLEERLHGAEAALAAHRASAERLPAGDKKAAKQHAARERNLENQIAETGTELTELRDKTARVEADAELSRLVREHPEINRKVLAETAALHAGDAENLRLWREFLPACLEENEKIYRRLGVTFDRLQGESFYHDRLAGVVEDLLARGLATESAGAVCVFDDRWPAPMIVRKQDGAFLYATSDLATVQYRMQEWRPDAILYVVDHRQSLHFQQLFDTARRWGYAGVEFQHVAFGTVLGSDGRPYKTRSGDTVGLMGLLDEAVRRAEAIVRGDPDAEAAEWSDEECRAVAQIVGIGALKYADLSQNRTSDYEFSYDKMLAMTGNTATYMQYAHARVQSIFRRGNVALDELRAAAAPPALSAPAERSLALALLRFAESLDAVLADYRPNQLTAYLFDLASHYSTFFQECPVLKAETAELRRDRLLLCDLTARTIRLGLSLLGIGAPERM